MKERRQFGKAIAEFQGVQFQLAQMATDLEAARLMVYNAARLKDAGQPFAQQAAMAKLFSSQVADRTTSNCLELFGGYGYSKEYPAEKYLSRRQDRDDLRGHQQHAACRRSPRRCSSSGFAGRVRPRPEAGALVMIDPCPRALRRAAPGRATLSCPNVRGCSGDPEAGSAFRVATATLSDGPGICTYLAVRARVAAQRDPAEPYLG